MNVIEVERVSYRHRRVDALKDVSFTVPQGALYALLGPNGSGKTTLLQCLMGLRTPKCGSARVLGADSRTIDAAMRRRIGYVAEGQSLPSSMRLRDVESYLAPLYAGRWDMKLANSLRDQFTLDASRRITHMSRGEQMKAALLCALAPRPDVLVMDEPFTGMDAIVKDDIVSGLLGAANDEGTTVLLCSHDIGELEPMADHVCVLNRGETQLIAPSEEVRSRFHHVELTCNCEISIEFANMPREWKSIRTKGRRMSFVAEGEPTTIRTRAAATLQSIENAEIRPATLREVFVAVVRDAEQTESNHASTEFAA